MSLQIIRLPRRLLSRLVRRGWHHRHRRRERRPVRPQPLSLSELPESILRDVDATRFDVGRTEPVDRRDRRR
jgi:hypothetical protein